MKGYKGMNKDMTCRGMQFEVGKTYRVDGKIKLCSNGLHFCENLSDCFHYYNIDNSRYFEVHTQSPVISDGGKSVTAELTIVKELSNIDVWRCFYSYGNGDGCGYNYGDGCGYNYSDGCGGYGDGYGYGGYNYSDGCGYDYDYSDGYGYGNVQKILQFI